MSVGGVGSSLSFWQQDQNYWAKAQQSDSNQSLSSAVISQMFNAQSTLATGLASIANQTALNRVNSQLTAAIQDALQQESGGSSTTSSSSSSSSSSSTSSSGSSTSSAPPVPNTPASGTGTAPLTTSTSLFTLGILKGGSITVNDGSNTTTYTSTGKDTVGDLINAFNTNKYGNADVAAGLNASGQLTITAKSNTATLTIGGAYAPNVGFGGSNDTFQPTVPPSSANSSSATSSGSSASTSSAASSGSSSSGSSTSGSSTSTTAAKSGIPKNSSSALLTGGTAELLLSSAGLSGSILNLLA